MSTSLFLTTGNPDQPDPQNDVVVELNLPQTPSWFGQGENEPVTADQITQAGGDQLIAAAKRLNSTPQALAGNLARTLPGTIDRLTPAGFAGAQASPDLAWYSLGRRVYLPWLQRFLSPDLDSPFASGGLNAYAYCQGDPANRVDPSGT
ncbi:RHS repeat-associated core domain-containing protein [Kitasatospora sp. NPDC089797]|uniref:RHS repeat-associated core domain-containing protein n=1 Tax=Kitasatospora sp. NPDC089797 TaxID=3155298 RepID=UPI0034440DA7